MIITASHWTTIIHWSVYVIAPNYAPSILETIRKKFNGIIVMNSNRWNLIQTKSGKQC